MSAINNVRQITPSTTQDIEQPETTKAPTQSLSFAGNDTLETSKPSALPDLQPNNLIGSTLESHIDSFHGTLNDVDEKLKDLESQSDVIKNDLDSMSEMGETESLRLQMAMDRMSKMMSTLANILKLISKTDENITQNMK
jgi:hypothetical protein